MASFSPRCEIRQLAGFVDPGGIKAPDAELRRRNCSAPGGPLTLQCGVNLLLAEALGHGDGGLEVQQLGQEPAACRCGLIGRRDRDGHTPWGFRPAAAGSGPP